MNSRFNKLESVNTHLQSPCFIIEFGTYGQWSPWKQETRNNVEILVRKRKCLNDICSGKDEETKSCTPTLCKGRQHKSFKHIRVPSEQIGNGRVLMDCGSAGLRPYCFTVYIPDIGDGGTYWFWFYLYVYLYIRRLNFRLSVELVVNVKMKCRNVMIRI